MWQRKGGVVKTGGNLLYILMTDVAKGSVRRVHECKPIIWSFKWF